MEKFMVKKTSSAGYAIGPAFLVEKKEVEVVRGTIGEDEKEAELKMFQDAVEKADEDLSNLAKESEIFGAHREILHDIALVESVKTMIGNGQNAQSAVADSFDQFIMIFESMNDEYMRERSADMKDVKQRLLMAMNGIDQNPFAQITNPVVIVAEDLVPSDTANMNFDYVLGFVTEVGGDTSHVAIIARNKGIPCLTGLSEITKKVQTGNMLVVDAEEGCVVLEPEKEELDAYLLKQEAFLKEKELLEKESTLPSVTQDGKKFEICANVGNLEDIRQAVAHPIDGIGLFRTEFLYMEKKTAFPTEEEQFEVYKEAAQLCGERELTIRTLDIGGDKGLDYFDFPNEENPFLGYRAIRICLDSPEMFKNQLRALLRASVYGNIQIMYPMLISIEELDQANALMAECKKELDDQNIAYNKNIEVGMMMETPAAVIMAEDFAKRVDFFSIGTNDLTQYVLAVDRGNDKIQMLYNSFSPAVVRAIGKIIKAAHAENIKVGMCGEFAGDALASEMLLGLGLDEFSMSVGRAAWVKKKLRDSNFAQACEKAEEALTKSYAEEIIDIFNK